nr:MAG TPA: hypothetical protein [Caudoviricetes sp.]DAS05997.1 MAG TPA: hypothetical protein [Caudoviricetes sp.]
MYSFALLLLTMSHFYEIQHCTHYRFPLRV